MKLLSKLGMASAFAVAMLSSVSASAVTYTFVGSWSVFNDDAPEWFGSPPNGPLAYTGQEAAALLFGGSASDYVISTVDSSVANINFMANYDVIGIGWQVFAQDHNVKYLGQYYGPTSGFSDVPVAERAASAFVRDNAVFNVNYAFKISDAVPEPGSWALMVVGFGIVGAGMRRRSAVVAA
jgi:hypothetical protein